MDTLNSVSLFLLYVKKKRLRRRGDSFSLRLEVLSCRANALLENPRFSNFPSRKTNVFRPFPNNSLFYTQNARIPRILLAPFVSLYYKFLRKRGDLNSRGVAPCIFSRDVPSTTRPLFQFYFNFALSFDRAPRRMTWRVRRIRPSSANPPYHISYNI